VPTGAERSPDSTDVRGIAVAGSRTKCPKSVNGRCVWRPFRGRLGQATHPRELLPVGLRFDSTEISHLLTPVQLPPIYLTDLPVERPQVVEQADAHQPTGEQVDNPGDPLAHVEAVDAEDSQECEQHPATV
jgi:hypothetical protein